MSLELSMNGLESEKQVVGGIYNTNVVIDDLVINAKQFSDSRLGNTFHIMKKLRSKGVDIDIYTVMEEAAAMKATGRIGDTSFQTELHDAIPSVTNIKYHESVIIENYKTRTLFKLAQELASDIVSKNAQEARQTFLEGLTNLDNQIVNESNTGHIREYLSDVFNDMLNDNGEMIGASTGFDGLDEILNGFQRQDLFLIGARPSMGKTAFVMNALRNHSAKGNVAALFSIEMPGKSIVKRLLASEANINSFKFRNPKNNFKDNDWDKLTFAMGILDDMQMYIYEEPIMDINFIRSKCAKLRKDNPEGDIVVAVDYIQIIKGDDRFKGNKNAEIGAISTGLKQIAREFDITMIALSQLSRGVEQRPDKRPMMSDLRESGQIEQDADVIAFLYRDEYYNKDSQEKGIAEFIIAKHRNGETGTVKLLFNKEMSKFIGY